MNLIYEIVFGLWLLCNLPRALFTKKFRSRLSHFLGLKSPSIRERRENAMRIWIHAVSLGETKAIQPFIEKVRESLPDVEIFVSSGTETGHKEALSLGGKIDQCFYLPLDTSFAISKLVTSINPDLFVLVESDYWYNLLRHLKENRTKIAVLNARISKSSYKLFKKIPLFSKKLFSFVDLYCVQSEEYKKRFLNLGVKEEKIHITGNLKFDLKKMLAPRVELNFPKQQKIVTIASTHTDEEELILHALEKLDKNVSLLIAPRHPERFKVVAEMLEKLQVPFRSVCSPGTGEERVVLVDKMGVLDQCYEVSSVAIMGGSFVKNIGGHNIYEPVRFGIPVIYGPYMHNQEMLVDSLKKHDVGRQIEIGELKETLEAYLDKKGPIGDYQRLKKEMEGATDRCWQLIKEL